MDTADSSGHLFQCVATFIMILLAGVVEGHITTGNVMHCGIVVSALTVVPGTVRTCDRSRRRS